MVMLPPPVAAPMVKLVTVTVTAVLAVIAWVAVVMTIWVWVGAAMVPVGPLPLIVTPKLPEVVKKGVGADGYVSVMALPIASAPPAVVVNENVAAADVLPATRSDDAIVNEGLVA